MKIIGKGNDDDDFVVTMSKQELANLMNLFSRRDIKAHDIVVGRNIPVSEAYTKLRQIDRLSINYEDAIKKLKELLNFFDPLRGIVKEVEAIKITQPTGKG